MKKEETSIKQMLREHIMEANHFDSYLVFS